MDSVLGTVLLPMGFAAVPSNGPNPKIASATDFRCLFCATFWTSKKWKSNSIPISCFDGAQHDKLTSVTLSSSKGETDR